MHRKRWAVPLCQLHASLFPPLCPGITTVVLKYQEPPPPQYLEIRWKETKGLYSYIALVKSSMLSWTLWLESLLLFFFPNLHTFWFVFFSFSIQLFLSYLSFLLSVWKQSDFASQDRFFAALLWACDQKRSRKQCFKCYDIDTNLPDLEVVDKTTSYGCVFGFFFIAATMYVRIKNQSWSCFSLFFFSFSFSCFPHRFSLLSFVSLFIFRK